MASGPEVPFNGEDDQATVDRLFRAIDVQERLAEPADETCIDGRYPPLTSADHPEMWATEEIEWGIPGAEHGDGAV